MERSVGTWADQARTASARVADRLVFNDKQRGDEIAALAGIFYNPLCDACIARVRGDELIGGVVFTDFNRESIQVHTGSHGDHWVNRDLLWCCLDYPFNQLGVKRVFGHVPETNEKALRFNKHLGAKVVARIEGVYKHGVACIVMRLDREDAHLLNVKPRSITTHRA